MKWHEALHEAHKQGGNAVDNDGSTLVGDLRESDCLLIPAGARDAINVNQIGVDALAAEFDIPRDGWKVKL